MAARAECFNRFAFIEEHPHLAFTHGQLGAPFDFTGTGLRQPVDQLFTAFIEPLEVFKKNEIVAAHSDLSLFLGFRILLS